MNGNRYPVEWEFISDKGNWMRIRVPGGWLVHHATRYIIGDKKEVCSECAVFVPDADKEWNLDK